MKMENFTKLLDSKLRQCASIGVLTVFFAVLSLNVQAQCPLGCNNNVQVSLDGSCSAVITPDVVLEGMGTCDNTNYRVVIENADGSIYKETSAAGVHPSLDASDIDMSYKVRVYDLTSSNGANSCWGTVSVEDKLAPVISCPSDITVGCNEVVNYSVASMTQSASNSSTFIYDGETIEVDGTSEAFVLTGGSSQSINAGETACLAVDVNGLDQFDMAISATFNIDLQTVPSSSPYTITVTDPAGNVRYTNTSITSMPSSGITFSYASGTQMLDDNFNGTWELCVSRPGGPFQIWGVTGNNIRFRSQGFFAGQVAAGQADNCDAITFSILEDETFNIDCDGSNIDDPFDATVYASNISAVRVITCQASDNSGNLSNICTKRIFFERAVLNDIVWPENYSEECRVNTSTEPSITGVPTIDGNAIWPNDGLCEINVTYNDTEIDICGESKKVLRNWVALDWCQATSTTNTQIIKIADTEGPVVTAIADMTLDSNNTNTTGEIISADPYTCNTSYEAPAPIAVFDCGTAQSDLSTLTYTVMYKLADSATGAPPANAVFITDNVTPSTTLNLTQNYTISGLPVGRTWLKYTIFDQCGNSTEAFTEVDVVDQVAPNPVCDENTVVTLNTSGWAHIFAETFDDGSHDNCDEELFFGVRRMSDTCGQFTGNSAGSNPTAISSTVFSSAPGNTYYDFVKFCCGDVDNDDIMVEMIVYDASGNWNTCMVNVRVDNKLTPSISCNLSSMNIDCSADIPEVADVSTVFTIGNDNCDLYRVRFVGESSTNASSCGEYTITRTWEVYNRFTDANVRTCNQSINVRNLVPFDMDNQINFPLDRTLSGCMADTDPSNPILGEPSYTGDLTCSQLASTYEDQTFTLVEDACLKILRTWTVIDWCQFSQTDPTGPGYEQYTQIIKVNNANAPTFDNCGPLSFCTTENTCEGPIELTTSATDDCTPSSELVYTWTIDAFNDGSGADFTGNGSDASNTYPVGTHSITWTVEDLCGNISTCTQTFTVRDCKAPTPYCLAGITTVVMPTTGTIEIWASDFDLGSFDNCSGDLRFSFSSNSNNTNMSFGCNDLGINQLQIWVTDAAGNQDFCETMIDIQNTGGCDEAPRADIAGRVATENNDMIDDVEVALNQSTLVMNTMMTSTDGNYLFQDVDPLNNLMVSAEKSGDWMNGVSTLDLVLIQKHILGIQSLDSPYKLIAADINNNNGVSAVDLIELRKLILGIYDELPSNTSWTFVDANQTFVDAMAPWNYTGEIIIPATMSNHMDNDFVGVKIGDVNGSAVANTQQENVVETRSGENLSLMIENVSFNQNDMVSVPVYAKDFNEIVGMQYTLAFDSYSLDFEEILADNLDLKATNVNAQLAANGMIAMSWNDITGVSVEDDQVLFTLNFRAKTNSSVENAIFGLSSEMTRTEAYTADLDVMNLSLTMRNLNKDFSLSQNTPNPFNGETQITFSLPKDMNAELTVYDVAGKVLHTVAGEFTKGFNTVSLSRSDLDSTSGILYYRLEAGDFTATKKMIAVQ